MGDGAMLTDEVDDPAHAVSATSPATNSFECEFIGYFPMRVKSIFCMRSISVP